MLGSLDQIFDDFHHHVRLITGGSGGMLDGSTIRLRPCQRYRRAGGPGQQLPAPDYLTPIAWQIAFRDVFPNSLFPWATYNRGDVLEDAWIAFDDGITQTFRDIKQKEEAGLVPSIVFSPMLVEDGRRLLISNLPLYDLTINHGNALLKEDIDRLRRRFARRQPRVSRQRRPRRVRPCVSQTGIGVRRRVLPLCSVKPAATSSGWPAPFL